MSFFLLLFLGTGFGRVLDVPPRDLASLLDPKVMLTRMNKETSEAALIRTLSETTGLTGVAEKRLREAVTNLGADQYKERARAKRLLRVAGAAALPFLEDAASSDDPEIRISASELLEAARLEKQEADKLGDTLYFRKLMAVRLLESEKSLKALPALKALADDERPTLAAAAADAVLAIEGKEVKRPEIKPILADIVQRIPPDAAFAGLMDFATGSQSKTMDTFLAEVYKDPAVEDLAGVAQMGAAQEQLTNELQRVIGTMGNVRVDAVFMVISKTLGGGADKGYVGFVFKGLCEPTMMDGFLKAQFENSYDHKGITIFYRADIAACRIDKNTVLLSIGRRKDGRHIEKLVEAFSGKVEMVSDEILTQNHPKIFPALAPVLNGDARLSVGGALSREQQTVAKQVLERDMARAKKRVAVDNNPRNQLNLAMTTAAGMMSQAQSIACSIGTGENLAVAVTLDTAEDANAIRDLLVSADKLLRENIKLRLGEERPWMFQGMKEMFGDLDKPYITVTLEKTALTIELKKDILSPLIMGL